MVIGEKYQLPSPPLMTILGVGLSSLSALLCATKEALCFYQTRVLLSLSFRGVGLRIRELNARGECILLLF